MDNLLRPWQPCDAPIILAAATEPEMDRQFITPIDSLASAEEWIAACTARRAEGTAYAFAVLDDGVPVGNVVVSSVERRHLTGWLSYWMVSEARGKGWPRGPAGSSASSRSRSWGSSGWSSRTGWTTPRPAGVAVGAGFLAEGVERAKLLYDGVRYDTETHARLATDQV